MTVIPENRTDVKVEFIPTNPKLPLQLRTFGGRTIVDGDLDRKIRDCHGSGDRASVSVRGVGNVGWSEMPQIVIRTPRDVDVDAGGAIWGTVGRSASLALGNAGCGDWTVGNVEGRMRLSQAGSGDTRAGSAGEAKVRVAGSGDTTIADVRGPVQIDIAGSGDVTVASVSGPLEVHVAGSGDVRVAGGKATDFDVSGGRLRRRALRRRRPEPEGPHHGLRRRPRPPGHGPRFQDHHGLRRGHRRQLKRRHEKRGRAVPKCGLLALDATEFEPVFTRLLLDRL